MTSKMDEIFKKVLNDRDIFWIKREIFSEREWNDLKREWNELKKAKDNHSEFVNIVNRKIAELKSSQRNDKKSESIEKKSIELCKSLISARTEKPNILKQMFENLNSYGLVRCNLGSMDDYGKVIERYGLSTVEQFFLDKIKKERDAHKRKALKKVLEYVKELYNANQPALEIAYFVRKLDSLTVFWEVLE